MSIRSHVVCVSTHRIINSDADLCMCNRSQLHQNACLGLPPKVRPAVQKTTVFFFFFVAVHTSLCNAWQAHAFRVSFWWRAAGAAYPAATRQGSTCSACDAAHTHSSTRHTRCIRRQRKTRSTERAPNRITAPEPGPTRSLRVPALFTLLFSFLFESCVVASLCLCVWCVCAWSKRNEK